MFTLDTDGHGDGISATSTGGILVTLINTTAAVEFGPWGLSHHSHVCYNYTTATCMTVVLL